jgi:hypothetical protein
MSYCCASRFQNNTSSPVASYQSYISIVMFCNKTQAYAFLGYSLLPIVSDHAISRVLHHTLRWSSYRQSYGWVSVNSTEDSFPETYNYMRRKWNVNTSFSFHTRFLLDRLERTIDPSNVPWVLLMLGYPLWPMWFVAKNTCGLIPFNL